MCSDVAMLHMSTCHAWTTFWNELANMTKLCMLLYTKSATASFNSQAPRASMMQPAPSAAPSVDMRAAVGQTLSGQTSVTAEETIHWKLMILHYDGSEHVDAVFRLREELSHR